MKIIAIFLVLSVFVLGGCLQKENKENPIKATKQESITVEVPEEKQKNNENEQETGSGAIEDIKENTATETSSQASASGEVSAELESGIIEEHEEELEQLFKDILGEDAQ